jgi:hypothetical protein
LYSLAIFLSTAGQDPAIQKEFRRPAGWAALAAHGEKEVRVCDLGASTASLRLSLVGAVFVLQIT